MADEGGTAARTALPGVGDRAGGIAVYTTALQCAVNDDLKKEWQEYLDQTTNTSAVVRTCSASSGSIRRWRLRAAVVRHIGESLVAAMEMALASGPGSGPARRRRVRRVGRDEGSPQLGADRTRGEKATGPSCQGAVGGVRRGRGRGRRAPVSHHRLDPRALDRVARHASGAASARGAEDVKTAIGAARAKNARDDMAKSD